MEGEVPGGVPGYSQVSGIEMMSRLLRCSHSVLRISRRSAAAWAAADRLRASGGCRTDRIALTTTCRPAPGAAPAERRVLDVWTAGRHRTRPRPRAAKIRHGRQTGLWREDHSLRRRAASAAAAPASHRAPGQPDMRRTFRSLLTVDAFRRSVHDVVVDAILERPGGVRAVDRFVLVSLRQNSQVALASISRRRSGMRLCLACTPPCTSCSRGSGIPGLQSHVLRAQSCGST